MRLWHEALIPYLDRQRLLGLHREVCALRGNGWGRKHATVNYVFEHPYGWLFGYHCAVMAEMVKRRYRPNEKWYDPKYRGEKCESLKENPLNEFSRVLDNPEYIKFVSLNPDNVTEKYIYPEHNDAYLQECLDNLKAKGVEIKMEESK